MSDTTFGPPAGASADAWDRHEAGECGPCIGDDHAECHGFYYGAGHPAVGLPPLPPGQAAHARLDGCACSDRGCREERGRIR